MASLNKLYTLHIPRTCSALRAWTSMQDKLKKCHLHSIYLQFPYLIYADFFVTKTTMQFFATKKICSHFFVANMGYAFFFAKTIYVLHPESFCALKVAIRKVQTFRASAYKYPLLWLADPKPQPISSTLLLSLEFMDWHLQCGNGFKQITRQRLVGSWWFLRQTPMKFWFW